MHQFAFFGKFEYYYIIFCTSVGLLAAHMYHSGALEVGCPSKVIRDQKLSVAFVWPNCGSDETISGVTAS